MGGGGGGAKAFFFSYILHNVFFLPSSFVLALVGHIVKVHDNAASHSAEDYFKREAGEVQSQVFPNFPLQRERAVYTRDCKAQDRKQRKDSCQKDFPSHSKLTPGLYLLTCGCPNKSVYGFSMMITGESPSMLFDLVMTRFEDTYNPHIIYDASCLAKEHRQKELTGNVVNFPIWGFVGTPISAPIFPFLVCSECLDITKILVKFGTTMLGRGGRNKENFKKNPCFFLTEIPRNMVITEN